MPECSFRFAGLRLVARPSGALWWPDRATLVVADLHFGKSERMARRGGALLPPYESAETLARLRAELAATGAQRLIALGDTLDDDLAEQAMAPLLAPLAARHEVIWITGNHDPSPADLPGHACAEWSEGGVSFRHIADKGPDISGHYHPKLMFHNQRIPVFLLGQAHLILPAFGAYTGGLDCDHPDLRALVPQGRAILTGRAARMVPYPLPARARPRRRVPN